MQWTKQQREAIEKTGSNLLVSAAAGSGKTAVLTERIKRLCVEEGVPVDQILVVTFTNAAAAEMKEKIRKALRAAADEDPARRRALQQQIRRANNAYISTFHKFSMGVIRRFFYLTDADPKFTICDDGRSSILRAHCLDELLEERFQSGGQAFLDFLDRHAALRDDKSLRSMILTVYDFIMSMADPFDWLAAQVEKLDADKETFCQGPVYGALLEQLRFEAGQAVESMEAVLALVSGMPGMEKKAAAEMDALEAVWQALADQQSDCAQALDQVTFQRYAPTKADKEAGYEDVKALVKFYHDNAKQRVHRMQGLLSAVSLDEAVGRMQDTYPHAQYLLELVRDFHARFQAEKRRLSTMDFNDIEHEALKILRHEEAAEAYQKQFQYIFIDEYQDSSLLQEEIIRLVSRGNNVYMVGDVKQSIYKFRLADPDLFIEKYNSYSVNAPSADGLRVDLNRNFRSKQKVIDTVNGIFRQVMDERLGGIVYDEAASLVKGAAIDDEGPGEASLHLVDTTIPEEADLDPAIAELKKSELEARVVAGLVAERVGKLLFDTKAGLTRPAGYGDIVILMRGTRGRSDIYAKALQDRGIPVYVDDGEGYYETNEIEVFMNLLRVIDNRRQDVPLLSVLRSPIFGFSIDELIDIRLRNQREDGRRLSYSEAFLRCAASASPAAEGMPDPLAYKCEEANARLEQWRRHARFLPLPELIHRLMTETGYLHYVAALPGGAHRAANLRSLVDKAVAFTESRAEGLFRFLHYAEEASRHGVRVAQAGSAGDARKMVRIMTIHKSKGLEFPIVVAADLARSFRTDPPHPDVTLHKTLGIGLKYANPAGMVHARTLPQLVINRVINQESLAEELRILYVAMTRAVDELVLVGSLRNLEKEMEKYDEGRGPSHLEARSFLDWIVPHREAAALETVFHDRAGLSADIVEDEAAAQALREELEAGFPSFVDEQGLLGELQERFDYVYPYMPFVISKSKYTVTELNAALQGRRDLTPERIWTGAEEAEAAVQEIREDKGAALEGAALEEVYPAVREICGDKAAPVEENVGAASAGVQSAFSDARGAVQAPEVEFTVPAFLRGEEAVTAARRGTLTHRVLELIPYAPGLDAAAVHAFTQELVGKGLLSDREAAAVRADRIADFFRSALGRRACEAARLKREWAFTLRKRADELTAMADSPEIADAIRRILPDEILIQGIIDCCFQDDEGIVILDFKTDRVRPSDEADGFARFRERYWRQLALYREVVEKATGESVQMTALFLLDTGAVIEV